MGKVYGSDDATLLAQALEKGAKPTRRGRHHSRPVDYDGHHFDSTPEYERYLILKDMQRRGEIHSLQVHPTFLLLEAFRDADGRARRKVEFTPDFGYVESDTEFYIVEDVKAKRGHDKKTGRPKRSVTDTDIFRLKVKWLLSQRPDIHFRIEYR